jgi:hypothetical protein
MGSDDARRPRVKGYKLERVDGSYEVTVPGGGCWKPCGHGPFRSGREAIDHANTTNRYGLSLNRADDNEVIPTHPRWHVIRTGPDVVIGTPAKRDITVRGVDVVIMRQHWEPPSRAWSTR